MFESVITQKPIKIINSRTLFFSSVYSLASIKTTHFHGLKGPLYERYSIEPHPMFSKQFDIKVRPLIRNEFTKYFTLSFGVTPLHSVKVNVQYKY